MKPLQRTLITSRPIASEPPLVCGLEQPRAIVVIARARQTESGGALDPAPAGQPAPDTPTPEAIDPPAQVPAPAPLAAIVAIATAGFVAITVVVTTTPSLGIDAAAFRIADSLRAPWLDRAAQLVTKLGLIAVVGPAVLVGAAVLERRRMRGRAGALVAGAALAWGSAWLAKGAIDRPRPTGALVSTAGASYPSAHSANSVGWLALALALGIVIPTRRGRIAAVAAGSTTAALVGLSRIYLRAHYASDVLAGEAIAVAMYALAALVWSTRARHRSPAAN